MQLRNALLAAIVTTALAGAVASQTDKHTHEHGSGPTASAESVKPQIAAKDLKERIDKGEKVTIIDARHDLISWKHGQGAPTRIR